MAVKKSELYSMLFEACNKLRGGVEPARYKDYVLLLLFFKYVSDRYKGQLYGEYTVKEGASFDDLIKLKGNSNIGEEVDKIIQSFLEANGLQGSLPDVSFNNHDELGNGKELVDKVSGLIAVFENPAIDFKSNRASGDDIIGDAYEYFMMKFAQESGKSKGQFYTPSEVSRIIARLIGIGEIENSPTKKWTLYDPAAGSGSLLIRAADEAPVDSQGHTIVSIVGQEKDNSTAGLAKMNFVLHQKGEGVIKRGNTLADPQTVDHGQLQKFDFIVMNPPFSDKSWSDGVNPSDDVYDRFDGYGIPPLKNGDYAWFLHVLKSLNSAGRAGIILPHGVLFRGNAEETIRKAILNKHYIEGIISLPPNLFFGTGIPACIIVIDKKDAEDRDGIFLIDASQSFKKDGSKNRLREQDIEKIIRTYLAREEIEGYSRFVTYADILKDNDGNLNITRYIQCPSKELPQNISAHLYGGIPGSDIASLDKLWEISPNLRQSLFDVLDSARDTYKLTIEPNNIEDALLSDPDVQIETKLESDECFDVWKSQVENSLLSIDANTAPQSLIRSISSKLLEIYKDVLIVNPFDVYDCLLNYWNEKMQDDVYVIKSSGYEAGREIEYVYGTKKVKGKDGETQQVEDKSKVKSWDGLLIPRSIIETVYFPEHLKKINELIDKAELLDSKLEELCEEESGDEGLLSEVLNEKGDVTKKSLLDRLDVLDSKRTSKELESLQEIAEMLKTGNNPAIESLLAKRPELDHDIRNKNGKVGKGKVTAAIKRAMLAALMPVNYQEEYEALLRYKEGLDAQSDAKTVIKELKAALDDMVLEKYSALTIEEIKSLLFNKKWMMCIHSSVQNLIFNGINAISISLLSITRRYEHTLSEINNQYIVCRENALKALERMGF